jgi:hypothetical protein
MMPSTTSEEESGAESAARATHHPARPGHETTTQATNEYRDEVFGAATSVASPVDPDAPLSYFSRRVLGELFHLRSTLCPCHIAANMELESERSLYPVLSFLLAVRLIRIVVASEQQTYFLDIEDDLLDAWEREEKDREKGKVENAEVVRKAVNRIDSFESFTARRNGWMKLFSEIGDSSVAPRYYIELTDAGAKRFRLESRKAA